MVLFLVLLSKRTKIGLDNIEKVIRHRRKSAGLKECVSIQSHAAFHRLVEIAENKIETLNLPGKFGTCFTSG